MALSITDIVNRALAKLGEEAITDLAADTSTRAIEARASYESVRDKLLRTYLWNFAIRRTTLATTGVTPSWGFASTYEIPAECLRLIQVGDVYVGVNIAPYTNQDTAEFRLEGRNIVTDMAAPLSIRYLERVTDTSLWDSAFIEAYACLLAAELCERRTQSTQKRQLAWQEYRAAVLDAQRSNAIENPPVKMPDSEWLLARIPSA